MNSKKFLGWAYLFITIFFFSTIEVATKPFLNIFNPFQITFLRFFIGGLFILLYLFLTKQIKNFQFSFKNLMLMCFIGSLNSLLSMSLLQFSIKFSNASTAAILISANPIFVLILASIILNEKITLKKIISLIVGIIGIIIILLSNNTGDSYLGLLFGLLSTFSFAFYTVMVKRYLSNIPSNIFVAFSFLMSSIPFYIVLKILKIPVFEFNGNFQIYLMLFYISIFVTGIAYITFFKALTILDASLGSFSFLLKPVISTILAYYFLNEVPNKLKLIGTIFVVLSVGILALKFQQKNN
ncbi:membrane protein [Tepiditoga spiralis]|uniref:Membrane protein n=1 Tax=Tepiditoga spiralis TaxID=2108365 RepID=A0A7G1G566_9BACT|nr:DMT family transporter [Tepiditoga spiralis]BBE29933.1 membrane protein [Tepiditoga spiralis]